MNNPLCKPPFDKTVCAILPPGGHASCVSDTRHPCRVPKLTPADPRSLFARLDSLNKRIAFLDAQIVKILSSYGL